MEGERRASESCRHSSDIPVSSLHCSSFGLLANGCRPDSPPFADEVDDLDSERAGVFDYIPQKPSARNDKTSNRQTDHCQSIINNDEEACHRKWARDSECNSNADYLSGKEMTTFHRSMDYRDLCDCDYRNKTHNPNSGDKPDISSRPDHYLEEVVVQSETGPRQALYEQYDGQSRRFWPSSNAAPVYITNIQRTTEPKNGYLFTDERDTIERRSHGHER